MTFKVFMVFQFFFLFCFDIQSQTIDETIKIADEMFEIGDYRSSLALYRRALFFTKGNTAKLHEKIADNFVKLEAYNTAENHYDSALINVTEKDKRNDLLYKKVDCSIYLKNYNKGISLLKNSELNQTHSSVKYNFYMGILCFGNNDFFESEEYLINTLCDTCISAKRKIHELFSTNFNYPDTETAQVLSSILPGLGQLYCGEYKQALNSFILIGLLVLIGYDMYINFGIADPLISVFPWFNRYFKGGIHNAEYTARKKQINIKNDILNKLIRISELNSI